MKEIKHQGNYESQLNRLFIERQFNKKGLLVPNAEVEAENEKASKVDKINSANETNLDQKSESTRIRSLNKFLNEDADITVVDAMGVEEGSKRTSRILYIGPNSVPDNSQ